MWMRMIFLLVATFCFSAEKPKVCLNMIVKNEAPVIEDCLNSVKPWIDYWVIVDTGSSDGTQEVIRNCMKAIPGELFERPWVDFAHNRNEAITLAKDKGDYLLLIDADEILVAPSTYQIPHLNQDCYAIYVQNPLSESVYQRAYLLGMHVDWNWFGVLHEGLKSEQAKTCGLLQDLLLSSNSKGGARTRDPNKYKKDVAVFEKALEKDPGNSRYVYYLAQSYNCDGNREKALETFQRRLAMGGSDEEIYHSLYMIGTLQESLEFSNEEITNSYCKAFAYRPTRAEPIFRLAQFVNRKHNFPLGYALCKLAATILQPNDMTYVENWIYEYGALSELAHSAFWLGKIEESRAIYEKLLVKKLPNPIREQIVKNLEQTDLRKKEWAKQVENSVEDHSGDKSPSQ
jgi:glycosyltransferase involved in cell wall biosynthesis